MAKSSNFGHYKQQINFALRGQNDPGGDGMAITLIGSGEVDMTCDEAQDVVKPMNDAICILPVELNAFWQKNGMSR